MNVHGMACASTGDDHSQETVTPSGSKRKFMEPLECSSNGPKIPKRSKRNENYFCQPSLSQKELMDNQVAWYIYATNTPI